MKNYFKNHKHIIGIIDRCIAKGEGLKDSIAHQRKGSFESELKRLKINIDQTDEATRLMIGQIEANFDLNAERQRNLWLEEIIRELEDIEGFKAKEVFNTNNHSIPQYLEDLFKYREKVLGTLPLKTSSTNEEVFELTIDTKKWALINNKTKKIKCINGNRTQRFLKVLIDSGDNLVTINEMRILLKYGVQKSCRDIKSELIGELKKLGISEEVRKNLILAKGGFALNKDYFKLI